MRRRIRQADSSTNAWSTTGRTRAEPPPHDADGEPILPERKNYFAPGRFYCLELMVRPCGVPTAFALFDRSESPKKIIDFIEKHHPRPQDKAQYYIIDKACMVLRRLITLGKWDEWKKTSRLIVDSYHYINHRVSDYLCRKWCNPAPMDGSAPNLVHTSRSSTTGLTYHKRAYNSQAAEQLNAWIAGYQPILNRMTVANFMWYVLVLLFLHCRTVDSRARERDERMNESDDEGEIEVDALDATELED
ncbi:hypothetical protein AURDEDRAFT_77400 [Auricularia subglabra TFB-10046 SS5]|uniref:Uncharacterized protein n=2 Tax=Auricularia subglabra (strain TFB-10046 / SS5) TaxID=717982 RepID=J0WM62_AURST|nr:hypothetical protein AURDEDRAFT_77400 [Auricularia subglabra TFB-10046 SS5]